MKAKLFNTINLLSINNPAASSINNTNIIGEKSPRQNEPKENNNFTHSQLLSFDSLLKKISPTFWAFRFSFKKYPNLDELHMVCPATPQVVPSNIFTQTPRENVQDENLYNNGWKNIIKQYFGFIFSFFNKINSLQ